MWLSQGNTWRCHLLWAYITRNSCRKSHDFHNRIHHHEAQEISKRCNAHEPLFYVSTFDTLSPKGTVWPKLKGHGSVWVVMKSTSQKMRQEGEDRDQPSLYMTFPSSPWVSAQKQGGLRHQNALEGTFHHQGPLCTSVSPAHSGPPEAPRSKYL